ncbi:DUF4012 domain-containing protein [Patescibacteria group bacterium]|nr:DUF4012 domain-containing protein [Patescibacteria group bacterium]
MATSFWKPGNKVLKDTNSSGTKKSKFSFIKLKKISLSKKQKKVLGILFSVFALFIVFAYFVFIRPGMQLVSHGLALKDSVSLIKTGFTNRDLIQMRAGFDSAEKNLADLRDLRNKSFGWLSGFGPLKGYYSDSEVALVSGEHLISAGRELATLSEPFADAIGLRVSADQEPSQLSLIDAVASWVSIMPDLAEDIDVVLAELDIVGNELAKIDPHRYPVKFRGIEVRANIERAQNLLSSVNDAGPDIKRALVIIPRLLGVDGKELRYMIIMQNDKEIRPTGGFWTNYATFKIRNAMLNSDFSSHDMYSIDEILLAIDSWYDFPDAPPAYERYLKVQHLYARDTNFSPDFPSSVAEFMKLYNLAMSINPSVIKPVDGVFTIDTVVLEDLMEITGPVTVNGFTYNSENVVLELEKLASLTLKEQAGRKDILGHLMQAMLINVFESDGNLWPSLIEKGIDLMMRKHVLVYMNDEDAQELFTEYGLAGAIAPSKEGEDYAFVVSTNLGGDKTNWFVRKSVTHALEKQNDKYLRTVKIVFNYDQPAPEYGAFAKRYQDWLRLYVPQGSEFVESTGFDTRFDGGTELDKDYFDGFFTLVPGERREITIKYYLPEGIVLGDKYRLLIQKQPGIERETHIVQLPEYTQEINLYKDVTFEHSL